MKKLAAFALVLVLVFSGSALAETKSSQSAPASLPMPKFSNVVKPILAEQGYDLEVVEYTDYVLPNTATESGELDANYFQHQPYLDELQRAERHPPGERRPPSTTSPSASTPARPTPWTSVADGATIAVPNDGTNEARALLLLEAQGLINLKRGRRLHRHQAGHRREPQEPGHR